LERNTLILIAVVAVVALGLGYFMRASSQPGNQTPTPTPTMESPSPTSEDVTPSPTDGEEEPSEEANITVTSPKSNDTVSSPLTITGQARVFENSLNYRLSDSRGNVLAEGFTTAEAPDIGQFGPYRVMVNFETEDRNGRLEVFSLSPRDGSEINKVTLPLRFR
jgi:cytoskeletal protein RodZ